MLLKEDLEMAAFPTKHGQTGMTLRDYFASQMAAARMNATFINFSAAFAKGEVLSAGQRAELRKNISEAAYADADALLEARKKNHE